MDLEKRLVEMKENKNEKIDYFDKMVLVESKIFRLNNSN